MFLDRQACDRARRSRDARFDGRFFIAVTSTRIYCRPICPAPSPKDENIRYFPTAAAAEAAGFRPCLRCRPEASPGTPAWFGTAGVVSRALRLIGDGAVDDGGVDALSERLGMTSRHLRRLFAQHLGATPIEVALTRRAHCAKKLIDETTLSYEQVAMAAGFGSVRRFNGEIRRTFHRTPSELRRLARAPQMADPGRYRFRLSYRPPYDWPAMLAFLAARATPGVERVDATGYARTICIDGTVGTIAVTPPTSGSSLTLDVQLADPRRLLRVVERVRHIFDLGADPIAIGECLGGDRLLRDAWEKHPGIRTPGAWDGFELAVRAILGQQVSVAGATTLAGRLAARFGTPLIQATLDAQTQSPALGATTMLFPTAAQLEHADIESIGVVRARAAAIRELASRVAGGTISFSTTQSASDVTPALTSIAGIGDWTAQYVAMRALAEPDAFPSGDLVLRRMAGDCSARELEQRSDRWRPWRAYAVMLLWQTAVDQASGRTRHAQVDKAVGRQRHVGLGGRRRGALRTGASVAAKGLGVSRGKQDR